MDNLRRRSSGGPANAMEEGRGPLRQMQSMNVARTMSEAIPKGILKGGSGSFFGGVTGNLPGFRDRLTSSGSRNVSGIPLDDVSNELNQASGSPPARPGMTRHGSVVLNRKHRLGGALAHGSKGLKDISFTAGALKHEDTTGKPATCHMCGDHVVESQDYPACDCSFQLCGPCNDHVKKYERNRCPGCAAELRDKEQWMLMKAVLGDATAPTSQSVMESSSELCASDKPLLKRQKSDGTPLVPLQENQPPDAAIISKADYGYGSVGWEHPPLKAPERMVPRTDLKKRSLSRKFGYSGSQMGPYTGMLFIRLCATLGFLLFRITNPTPEGYWLWLMSVICETWFAVSWVLDTLPKLSPVRRETYKDRLRAIYDDAGVLLPQLDVFITTADATKEPPLTTCNTILSVLASDYSPERLACYLSDDGASKLMFDCLAEAAGFARIWVPFCKKHGIEPRAPEMYFSMSIDYLKDKVHPDFVKTRRRVKREYEEFKVRINALVAASRHVPEEGWLMDDGTPWPGNNRRDHDGIIQVFLHPDSDVRDVDGGVLPPLVYISREKRPGYDHNKKAGAMNALLRASGLISNGPFLMNLDCDHYINNSAAFREALCYFLDPIEGHKLGFVQFPQRFDGIDKSDRYANHNTVFFDINMKGLDGQQGPVYVGTGCFFRRKALYGFDPPMDAREALNLHSEERSSVGMCSCCMPRKINTRHGSEHEAGPLLTHAALSARMGACESLVVSATAKDTPQDEDIAEPRSPRSMLNDVVHTVSCDYEANTDWGKTIGWMYGSVTEDILTGMKVHTRGWFSAYADPEKAAFKGSAPLNMTDRLHQVERWATGAVEIFFSARNPLWSHCGTRLSLRQRIAYANNAFYPFTSVAIFMYCLLPPLALMTDVFFVPTLDQYAVIWFTALITSFIATSILELRWSKVSFEAWWRNEQFWLIAGISAHLAAVVQGLLKVIAGLEISFTLTSKGGDDENTDELHTFKFSWLLLPGCFIGIFNLVGIIVGFARAMGSSSSQEWGKLAGKLVFSFWVLIHLYPFGKGLLGKRDRIPTIVIIWSVLLVVTVALLWSNFAGGFLSL